MRSMTGYGKAEYNNNNISLIVEIKTVNNRYLDLSLKYPKCLMFLDDKIRKTISSKVVRGKLDLFVAYVNNNDNSKKVIIDKPLAVGYYNAAKEFEEVLPGIRNDFSVNSLFKNPDIVTVENIYEDEEMLKDIVINTISEALDKLNSMREIEGEKLKQEFILRLNNIKSIVDNIKIEAPKVVELYKEKLQERLKQLLDNQVEEQRFLQEVALYADKSNIDEEITRLYSHINQFEKIINGDGDVGKKLDFLLQEFNREANTICSKANEIKITDEALKLKCEIEKVREQVQNIE